MSKVVVFAHNLMLSLALVAVVVSGCTKTTVGVEAYQLAGALDRIFEKRDPGQLNQASEKVNEELASGKITENEAKLLNALIAKAQRDDWAGASSDARKLLADQTDW